MPPSHAVSVLLDDELLTFNRVIGVVRRRNLPVEGLAVGPSGRAGVVRLTCFTQADEAGAERMLRQLEKTHGVHAAALFPAAEAVTRELALIKVTATDRHADVVGVASRFQARVIGDGAGTVILELGGSPEAIQSLVVALEPFGIIDIARSGVAVRGGGSPALSHPSEAVK